MKYLIMVLLFVGCSKPDTILEKIEKMKKRNIGTQECRTLEITSTQDKSVCKITHEGSTVYVMYSGHSGVTVSRELFNSMNPREE